MALILVLVYPHGTKCKCMYVCMVITYSRVWINRVRLPILLVVSWTRKMNFFLTPFAPENLASRDGFGHLVLRHPVRSLLYTQTESVAYSRDSSRFPRRRPFIYLNRRTPSGQSRVYRVTQLRTDGVPFRESAGTGPVVLKVVRVTGAAFAGYHGPINVRFPFPTPTMI